MEIAPLRIAGLVPDLRWLMDKGFVEHRREQGPGRQGRRRFSPRRPSRLGKRSCFVLTASGVQALGGGEAANGLPARVVPYWYGGPIRCLLWMGCLVKDFHQR